MVGYPYTLRKLKSVIFYRKHNGHTMAASMPDERSCFTGGKYLYFFINVAHEFWRSSHDTTRATKRNRT